MTSICWYDNIVVCCVQAQRPCSRGCGAFTGRCSRGAPRSVAWAASGCRRRCRHCPTARCTRRHPPRRCRRCRRQRLPLRPARRRLRPALCILTTNETVTAPLRLACNITRLRLNESLINLCSICIIR